MAAMRAVGARLRDHRGSGVVEVLIALGVVTMGVQALIAALPVGTSHVHAAQLRTTATFLAQQRLEQIKRGRWTADSDTLGGLGADGRGPVAEWPDEDYRRLSVPSPAGCAVVPDGCYPGFRRQVRISDCSVTACSGVSVGTAGIAGLRQVAVTVFFAPLSSAGQRLSSEERVQLVTLVARRP